MEREHFVKFYCDGIPLKTPDDFKIIPFNIGDIVVFSKISYEVLDSKIEDDKKWRYDLKLKPTFVKEI